MLLYMLMLVFDSDNNIASNYFPRVIPALTHYSDIVSDIPSGSIYIGKNNTFFLACTLTFFLAFYLASILTYFLAYMLTFFLAV